MKVLSISTDRNIFKEGSPVLKRMQDYGTIFDELHIVVFSRLFQFLPRKKKIAPNVWAYATRSFTRLSYIKDAQNISRSILKKNESHVPEWVISVQDPFETGIVGLRLKEEFDFPLHVQIHTDFLNPYFADEYILNSYRLKIAEEILPKADAVRVVSKRIANSLFQIHLKPGVIPMILPIFVDIKKIENTQVTEDLHKKYPKFNFIILMVCRLAKEKNIPLAFEIVRRLSKAFPKIGLVIVGSGEQRGRLSWLSKRLGIAENVVFEPWRSDTVSYYKTANIHLITSNYEGYGMTIIEAIASHCPVISTDVGIASEVLGHGQNYSICPIGDASCFFNKIFSVMREIEIRERMVHGPYERLKEVIVPDKQTYLKLYKKSVESAAGHE